MTPREFEGAVIKAWEGELSVDPRDPGNWVNDQLIGSKYGVTAQALALHRKVTVASITASTMAALTLEEAEDISIELYGFPQLTWAPATAELNDFSWGSGRYQASLSIQRLIGVNQVDGVIGPASIAAFDAWLQRVGREEAAQAVLQMRLDFYKLICVQHPNLSIYLTGWTNRATWAHTTALQIA